MMHRVNSGKDLCLLCEYHTSDDCGVGTPESSCKLRGCRCEDVEKCEYWQETIKVHKEGLDVG